MTRRVVFIAISALTFLLVILLCGVALYVQPEHEVIALEDGWTVTMGGQIYEDVVPQRLSDAIPLPLSRGDVLELSTMLPDAGDLQFPAILYKTQYCAWQITLYDGSEAQLLSEGGQKYLASGAFLGCGYHFISLPRDYAGKRLTVTLTAAEQDAFSAIETPLLGSHHDLEYGFLHRNLFPIAVSIYLFIFGGCFLFITLIFYSSTLGVRMQLFSSILYIDLGIWLIAYYNAGFLFFNGAMMTFLEYITLYLIIPLSFLVLACIGTHRENRIFRSLQLVCTALPLLFIVLHLAGVIYMNRLLPLYHVICFVSYLAFVQMCFQDLTQHKLSRSDRIQLLGLFLFSTTIILDMVIFVARRTFHLNQTVYTAYLLPIGAMLFAFSQLVNYFLFVSESYARVKEYDQLTRMAYEDSLTDLANRTRSERYMEALAETHADYCVISLDLNGLKEVNDNYGHAAGDKYLKEFSTAFRSCFDESAFLSRLGGDEFMVVLRHTTPEAVDAALLKLTGALDVMNALYPGYHRSVAAGYAFRHEVAQKLAEDLRAEDQGVENMARRVYQLADERMYADKERLHEKLGDRRARL